MKTCIKRPHRTQSDSGLPLFSCQMVVIQPSTRAGQYVAQRYRVHPALADLALHFLQSEHQASLTSATGNKGGEVIDLKAHLEGKSNGAAMKDNCAAQADADQYFADATPCAISFDLACAVAPFLHGETA